MTVTEIILIVIGLILIIGSFFIKEMLSKKDIEEIARLSEKELQEIIDRQMKQANNKIEESVDEMLSDKTDETKRDLERETNEKIMAISEFSDTVLDSMNKTHTEIVFLYNMLKDKHGELTELAGDLQHFSSDIKATENEILERIAEAAIEMEQKVNSVEMNSEKEIQEALVKENAGAEEKRSNSDILELHEQGKSDVEIAKILGRGLGEVKLVIGLYRQENTL